jgi:hypothetical protein
VAGPEEDAVIRRLALTEETQIGSLDAVRKAEVVAGRLRPERPAAVVVDEDARPAESGDLDRRRQPGRSTADDRAVDDLADPP